MGYRLLRMKVFVEVVIVLDGRNKEKMDAEKDEGSGLNPTSHVT